jgi:2-oxoisovalerate dehydrogenase E2 component (dihydrolipoyl transacylase)
VSGGVTARRTFALPDLGEGLTEAEIVSWRVAVGDVVALNQVLVEVETEKAVVELPSPFAGAVAELLAAEGAMVAVGSPIVAIDTAPASEEEGAVDRDGVGAVSEARTPVLVGYGPEAAAPSRRRRAGRPHRAGPPPPAGAPARPLAAPPVRFMARQQGVDLAEVAGHGPGGIITREDLASHLATAAPVVVSVTESGPEPGGFQGQQGRETRTPVRGVQMRMAEAMVRSVADVPQACVFLTVDVTPTMELIARLRENRHFAGIRVTPLAVVARAVLLALRVHPALNASWDDDGPAVVSKHYVNLGIAVAAPSGLLVPNVKGAHDLSLRDLAAALSALTVAARGGRCTPTDLTGGTFTITNVGVFGVDAGVPLLNPGEGAILAFGTAQPRPWQYRGEVALRDVCTLSLAFDHRLVDGEAASRFLAAVGEILADPTTLIALS